MKISLNALAQLKKKCMTIARELILKYNIIYIIYIYKNPEEIAR